MVSGPVAPLLSAAASWAVGPGKADHRLYPAQSQHSRRGQRRSNGRQVPTLCGWVGLWRGYCVECLCLPCNRSEKHARASRSRRARQRRHDFSNRRSRQWTGRYFALWLGHARGAFGSVGSAASPAPTLPPQSLHADQARGAGSPAVFARGPAAHAVDDRLNLRPGGLLA
uniref:Uncharacterized protein n=1 Tax=uncultured alpha proteobacterium HF0010_30A23 TaxID=710802 RepID=E0XRK1_9PROT|nr:hypothetical protein [uncultured alpha proteobacterium HF0010_30A23]